MSHARSAVAAAVPVLVGLLCAGLVEGPSAAPALSVRTQPPVPAAAAATERPGRAQLRVEVDAVRYPRRRAVVVHRGSHVTVAARFAHRGRRVHLQVDTSGWTTVATSRTRRGGKVAFRVPTAATGRTQYRVLAPAQRQRQAEVSQPMVVSVQPTPPDDDLTSEPAGPAALDGTADSYTLFDTGRPGAVFRWDPCTPIRYRVHLAGAPAALAADVAEAVARMRAATGLTFTDLGATDYAGTGTDPEQMSWPADTDLLVTVAAEGDVPALAGAPVGYATLSRSTWAGVDARILRAEVVLEREFVTSAATGSVAGAAGTAQLLLHELGHAVGLAHTEDRTQIMYPEIVSQRTDYQTGDRAGLARVGSAGGCLS